jgi:hypothetical protein
LFDPRAPTRHSSFFEIRREGEDLVATAGTIHGINTLTEFALYEHPDKNSRFLGFFAVRKAKEFTSVLKVTDSTTRIATPAFALPIKALRVAFANNPGIIAVADALQREAAVTQSNSYRYSFVRRDQAALELDISEDKIVFNNVNSRVQTLGYSRLPYEVRMGETQIIRSILEAASNFELLLNIVPEDRIIRNHIQIEFTEIKRPNGGTFGPAVRQEDAQDLCRGDFVEVTAGDTTYGMKITNNSPFQLYPHLFLFDCSDLSIRKDYLMWLQFVMLNSVPRVILQASICRSQGRGCAPSAWRGCADHWLWHGW